MPSAGIRVTGAAVVGAAVGMATAFVAPWQASGLAGWDSAAAVFLVLVWRSMVRMHGDDTKEVATRVDPNRIVADAILVGASVGCLVGVGFALAKAKPMHSHVNAGLVALAVLSVVLSWAVVHTVYALHYARLYYGQPEGGVDFGDGRPDFSDFAYLAFTVGMTYQVSDTGLATRSMRRAVLGHALLSFLFGTFILAVTLNVLADLV